MTTLETTDADGKNLAACAEPYVDQDLWFDVVPSAIQQAIDICKTCPIAEQCLKYALTENIQLGIWGGLTEIERQNILKKSSRMFTRKANK
jgi:WhiB family redox-sensing transcriptional regulator